MQEYYYYFSKEKTNGGKSLSPKIISWTSKFEIIWFSWLYVSTHYSPNLHLIMLRFCVFSSQESLKLKI
jgi:hypothetical protein